MATHIIQSITAAALAILILFSGCTRTQYVPVEKVRVEHVEADTARFMALINSLRQQVKEKEHTSDSIIRERWKEVTVNEQGDTTKEKEHVYVYISSKQKKEYENIIERKNDSILMLTQRLESVKSDSVPVPYPVERELSPWEQTKLDYGGEALVALPIVIIAAVAWLIRINIKRRK